MDTVYAQVREVGDGWVRVLVLTEPTEAQHVPAAPAAEGRR